MADPTHTRAHRLPGAAISSNIVASLARVAVVSLVGIALPAFLTKRLPVSTYAAWVLILQLAAYVSYLDLGIQTGVAKFVAEYQARGDTLGASRHASAGIALTALSGSMGVLVTLLLTWNVPSLFRTMPASLYHDVRMSLLLVGTSLSFGLVCAIYSAVFLGLQRYWLPMTIAIANRVFFAAVVFFVVTKGGSLTAMALGVACGNVLTGVLQVSAWRTKVAHIRVSARLFDWEVMSRMARYCFFQSIWTLGMLCVTGLDVTIVGHYDYVRTAYYSVATLPTSFLLLIISSMLNPLLPAFSAMSTRRTATEMGEVLANSTRYTTVALLTTGLPLIVFGFPILRLWVGAEYASQTVIFLRILVIANVIRNLGAPYATMVSATGQQGAAIATAISEASVNLVSSIYLASRFGAVGVALGTLLGSMVSLGLHFAVTMHLTRQKLAISRINLLCRGVLLPGVMALPSVLTISYWWPSSGDIRPLWMLMWLASSIALLWFAGLNGDDRRGFIALCKRRVGFLPVSP